MKFFCLVRLLVKKKIKRLLIDDTTLKNLVVSMARRLQDLTPRKETLPNTVARGALHTVGLFRVKIVSLEIF
jgi:hypothetical protein